MKYLISGASGFIGSSLYFKLLELGHEPKAIPRDILYNYFSLKEFFELEKPDYIIHLAAWGNHSTQTDFDKIISSNIDLTINLLQASKDIDYKGFINIGSSSEYGTKKGEMSESDFLETDTYYGASKVATTYLTRAFSKQEDKPIVTIRPFSVYGELEAKHRFIPTVIISALEDKTFDLAEKPMHDWIYIDDFLNGLLLVAENINNLKGQVVNIGTGKQYSNLEVVKLIEKIHGEIKYNTNEKLRSYDSGCWVADNNKLKSLGWKQKYSLDQGLKKTYEYIKGS
jgi:nucleoside-diphosphate-sugar epimerase